MDRMFYKQEIFSGTINAGWKMIFPLPEIEIV
jgi:hypothetical protein